MNSWDPAQTLSPDDPLREWAKDPAKMEIIRQKALEDASNATGLPVSASSFADPSGNNIDPNSGMPTTDLGTPVQNNRGLTPPPEPYRMPDPVAAPPPETTIKVNPSNAFDPEATTPMPSPRPTEAGPGASDLSAQSAGGDGKEGPSAGDRITKALAGLKAMTPPAPNPVGTPGVRAPNNIASSSAHHLLALLGQQAAPDPIATLGRLLVAGKA